MSDPLSKRNLIIYLSMQGWAIFGFAPQGCPFNAGEAQCDFRRWKPPLTDDDFGPEPLHKLKMNNINAAIPANIIGRPIIQYFDKVSKYNVGLKTLLLQGLSVPGFYGGDLVYKFRKIIGWCIFGFAPQGCSFSDGEAQCNFQQWKPPLLDDDFGPEPLHKLELNRINADIPASAFIGLNGSLTNSTTSMRLNCIPGCNPRLSRDIFTANLYWVMKLQILNCDFENGLPERMFENMKRLNSLKIISGKIDEYVAKDTLSGLTELREIIVQAPFMNITLPSGLFDGLVNLTDIFLRYANLEIIPPNWFDGLVNLKHIQLHNNNIRTLPQGLFDELTSLTTVTLNNNPLDCSCGLAWLLGWSDITDGAFCKSPPSVENKKVENAFDSLDCTTPTSPILSTASSPGTEITTVAISSVIVLTETVLPVVRASVSVALKQGKKFSTLYLRPSVSGTATFSTQVMRTSSYPPMKKTAIPINVTADNMSMAVTSIPVTVEVTTVRSILTNTSVHTTSWTASNKNKILTEKLSTNLPSMLYDQVRLAQAVSFSTPKAPTNFRRSHNNLFDVNGLRNTALISTFCTLPVLLMSAALLYRYVCRNKNIRSVNRVSGQEEMLGPNHQGIAIPTV